LQTMWLHPPSFSIVALHLGHSYYTKNNRKWMVAITLTINHQVAQYLGVCCNPIGSFGVIVTLFYPLPEKCAANRLMPVVTTCKTERMSATTSTIRTWAPP
jgi:hypothetical protein